MMFQAANRGKYAVTREGELLAAGGEDLPGSHDTDDLHGDTQYNAGRKRTEHEREGTSNQWDKTRDPKEQYSAVEICWMLPT